MLHGDAVLEIAKCYRDIRAAHCVRAISDATDLRLIDQILVWTMYDRHHIVDRQSTYNTRTPKCELFHTLKCVWLSYTFQLYQQ